MSFFQRLLEQVSDLRHDVAHLAIPATVAEVKGDKMRCIIGNNEGKPVYTGWLNTANHRGQARERRAFLQSSKTKTGNGTGGTGTGGTGTGGTGTRSTSTKRRVEDGEANQEEGGGQNVILLCPAGRLDRAVVLAWAPNKNALPPDHANDTGQDEETYQFGSLRVRKYFDSKGKEVGYDIWLQEPKKQQQQQQGQQGDLQRLPEHKSDISGQAEMKLRLNKNGGITGRIGKDVRFAAHKKGAKLKAGNSVVVVTSNQVSVKASGHLVCQSKGNLYCVAGGTPYVNKPWREGGADANDPVPDDDQ